MGISEHLMCGFYKLIEPIKNDKFTENNDVVRNEESGLEYEEVQEPRVFENFQIFFPGQRGCEVKVKLMNVVKFFV